MTPSAESLEHPAGLDSPHGALQARDLDQQPRPVDLDRMAALAARGWVFHQHGEAEASAGAATGTSDRHSSQPLIEIVQGFLP